MKTTIGRNKKCVTTWFCTALALTSLSLYATDLKITTANTVHDFGGATETYNMVSVEANGVVLTNGTLIVTRSDSSPTKAVYVVASVTANTRELTFSDLAIIGKTTDNAVRGQIGASYRFTGTCSLKDINLFFAVNGGNRYTFDNVILTNNSNAAIKSSTSSPTLAYERELVFNNSITRFSKVWPMKSSSVGEPYTLTMVLGERNTAAGVPVLDVTDGDGVAKFVSATELPSALKDPKGADISKKGAKLTVDARNVPPGRYVLIRAKTLTYDEATFINAGEDVLVSNPGTVNVKVRRIDEGETQALVLDIEPKGFMVILR